MQCFFMEKVLQDKSRLVHKVWLEIKDYELSNSNIAPKCTTGDLIIIIFDKDIFA